MLKPTNHPTDPEARIRGRRGLVPTRHTMAEIESAATFALVQLRAEALTPAGAFHYASALGVLLWVLPFAEQSARQAPPHLREHPDSSDAAARAFALARRVVEAADAVCGERSC